MRFTLTIDCDNAAFGDNPSEEIARILAELAPRIERTNQASDFAEHSIYDYNGNKVGTFRMKSTRRAKSAR